MDWQPNDVEVTALDVCDMAGCEALNGICASFAEGFAAVHIGIDIAVRHGRDGDLSVFNVMPIVIAIAEAKSGKNRVGAALERFQHGFSFHGVERFLEDPLVSRIAQHHGCVGGEDALVRGGDYGGGLFTGQTSDIGRRIFVGLPDFSDTAGTNQEGDASLNQDVPAARGLTCEHEFEAGDKGR